MNTRKVRIVSDGTPNGTRVVDEATGEPLSGVVGVDWSIEVNQFAEATVSFVGVPVDLVSEARALFGDEEQE